MNPLWEFVSIHSPVRYKWISRSHLRAISREQRIFKTARTQEKRHNRRQIYARIFYILRISSSNRCSNQSVSEIQVVPFDLRGNRNLSPKRS